MQSPIQYFSTLADPRHPSYIRHKLIDIIAITIAAVICGANDWHEVEDYGLHQKNWLQAFLELPYGIPSHDTFSRFFSAVDTVELEQCFVEWIKAIANLNEGRIIAIDGKTLRGSSPTQDGKSFIHMVSAWCTSNGLVLGQQKVQDKSNEITAIPSLLDVLVLKGCLVTIDAMGCQQAIAEKIIQQEGDYILAVKDNQKFLHQDIQEAFEHAAIEDYYSQTELAHGRIETRTTSLITDMDWICSREQWAGLACIIRVEATREQKKSGLTENSTRYYISSKTATAQYLQASIRSHWAIENKLHWMLDVAFGEDNSKKRKNNSAQNFSLISKIALQMIQKHPQDPARGAKKISVKRKRKIAAWDKDYLLSILKSFN